MSFDCPQKIKLLLVIEKRAVIHVLIKVLANIIVTLENEQQVLHYLHMILHIYYFYTDFS